MKKIGTTTTGGVIVEMTAQEYAALEHIKGSKSLPASTGSVDQPVPLQMNHSERSAFVAERLKKLRPKKKDGVIHSIKAMFQFTGGIDSSEIEKVLSTLQKQGVLSIAPDGRVTYTKG